MNEFYKDACIEYIKKLGLNGSNDGGKSKGGKSKDLVNISKSDMDDIMKGFLTQTLGVDLFTAKYSKIEQT